MGTLHGDQYICSIISRSVLLRMKNVSEKVFEKPKTHILCSVTLFFFFENPAVCEIMWKKFVKRGRPRLILQRMRIAC